MELLKINTVIWSSYSLLYLYLIISTGDPATLLPRKTENHDRSLLTGIENLHNNDI